MTFPTFTLTSPHKKGQAVKDAQYLMEGNNRFGEKYYSGKIDGDYGTLTGAGAYRAKYWTGYKLSDCNHAFGATLYSYLLPLKSDKAKKLPVANRLRRKWRLAQKKKRENQKTLGEKAFEYALQFLGYREGFDNDNKFGAFFGINHNPWCGCFVSYSYTKVGHYLFLPYVPNIVSWARAGLHGLYEVKEPKKGDLVCFDWQGDGLYDHVALVESFDGTTIHTLEGNTLPPDGVGDQGNGGGVYRRERSVTIRHVFVRVQG